MKNRICTFFISLLLLLIVINVSVKGVCVSEIFGTVKLNNQLYQGARVYVKFTFINGSFSKSDVSITNSLGTFDIFLCNFNWQATAYKKEVIAEYPTGTACPTPNYISLNFIGLLQVYDFNNITPSGSGNYSGLIYVSGAPAPYHTIMDFGNGYCQTTDNSGSFNSPTSYPYGSPQVTITVYTQPNITTGTYSFCFNTPNQIVYPEISINNFQTGYITGTLYNSSCSHVANNIVYYHPTISNGMAEGWTMTDANGCFTTYNLPVGNYDISSTYNGIFRSRTVTVQAGQNSEQNLYFGQHSCSEKRNIGNQDNEITGFQFSQNYPNPFNPSTLIRFNLEKETFVSLKIYDMLGQEVAILVNGMRPGGRNEVVWNGVNKENKSLSAGTYIYSLKVNNIIYNKKMILLK